MWALHLLFFPLVGPIPLSMHEWLDDDDAQGRHMACPDAGGSLYRNHNKVQLNNVHKHSLIKLNGRVTGKGRKIELNYLIHLIIL